LDSAFVDAVDAGEVQFGVGFYVRFEVDWSDGFVDRGVFVFVLGAGAV
jgi:hypothetical protein